MFGRRDPMDSHPVRPGGAIHVRWYLVVLLALIAIAAVAGIIGSMAAGHTQLAIIIGIVTAAFFSRSLC